MQRQTPPPTTHTQHVQASRALVGKSSSSFLGNRASLEPSGGRPQPPSLVYCSRQKYMHSTCRNAVLSTLDDGETTFQISDPTRSAAYLVTKQECYLQVSN
jgi:hypothetical protein